MSNQTTECYFTRSLKLQKKYESHEQVRIDGIRPEESAIGVGAGSGEAVLTCQIDVGSR